MLIAVNIYCYLIKYLAKQKYLLQFHDTKLNYCVNPLNFIFRYVNGYFDKINGNKYLALVHTNESKDLIRPITKNSDDYDEEYIQFRFNSDDNLPLNKMVEISTITIVVEIFFLKIINVIHKFS